MCLQALLYTSFRAVLEIPEASHLTVLPIISILSIIDVFTIGSVNHVHKRPTFASHDGENQNDGACIRFPGAPKPIGQSLGGQFLGAFTWREFSSLRASVGFDVYLTLTETWREPVEGIADLR